MDAGTLLATLLSDSRFPAGTYAHSLGLEQAVREGLRAGEVPAFLRARLLLVAEPEAHVTVAARRAAAAGDVDGLVRLDREQAARTPSHVQRDQARRLGSQLLRTAATVWPDGGVAAYRAASSWTPRPVALGVVAAAAGLDDEQAAGVAVYDDASTVASAALKLLPLDPAHAAGWVAALAPELAAAARRVATGADDRPLSEQPAPAAPALEHAATLHHHHEERLFVT